VKITLSKGLFAIIDEEDFERVNKFKWHAEKPHNTYYALRQIRIPNGKKRKIYMRRFILGFTDTSSIDHINRNGLDNRRVNLAPCTVRQNSMNRRDRNGSYPGITWKEWLGKWEAHIMVGGKTIYLGISKNARDAHQLYLNALKKYTNDKFLIPGGKE